VGEIRNSYSIVVRYPEWKTLFVHRKTFSFLKQIIFLIDCFGFTHDIDVSERVDDGIHYLFWNMLQLVVLQVKGLQRVEILESLRRYYLDAERRIMQLRILFNFVITISKVRVNSIKIELMVLNLETSTALQNFFPWQDS
jgi:hypothetical protein